MTTTQDTRTCEHPGCQEEATHRVTAQHLDPDDDGTGRMIGWSGPMDDDLCDEHLLEWDRDELVGLIRAIPI